MIEAVRKSLQEYAQFPMWDPWHNGGMPLLGNPQTPLSPFYLPVFIFGTVVGTKVSLFILHIVGFIGSYLLGRHLSLDHLGGIIAAVAWSLCGLHAVQLQAGWFLFSHIQLIPFIFLIFFIGKENLKWIVPMAFLLSLLFMGGSPYPFVITMTSLGFLMIATSVKEKSYKPVVFVFASSLLFSLLSAVKIIPAVVFMLQYPRELPEVVDGYSFYAFFSSLLNHSVNLTYPANKLFLGNASATLHMAPEYGMYIGPFLLLLTVVGLTVKFGQRVALLTMLLLLLLLVMGNHSPIPFWPLLNKLPVYDSMQVVERFRWPLVLVISLLAAFGAGKISSCFANRDIWRKVFLLIIVINLSLVNIPLLWNAFPVNPRTVLNIPNSSDDFFQIIEPKAYDKKGWVQEGRNVHPLKSSKLALFPYIMNNIGIVVPYEPIAIELFARGKGADDYKGETFIYSSSGFQPAVIADWSPNRVKLEWKEGVEGDIYLNQNRFDGWKVCDNSGLSLGKSGLLMVPIASKDSSVELCYAPRHIYVGILISILSLFASVAYLAYDYKKHFRKAIG